MFTEKLPPSQVLFDPTKDTDVRNYSYFKMFGLNRQLPLQRVDHLVNLIAICGFILCMAVGQLFKL